MRSIRISFAVAAALAYAATGCGSSETVTVTEESPTPPPETVTQRADPPKKKKKSPAPAAQDDAGGEDTGAVPDLVGMDHQLAQDTLQAAGFYLIKETDCSGEDRLLLWDRNWVVVEQDPPGGTSTSVDATITLCSVKDGEQ